MSDATPGPGGADDRLDALERRVEALEEARPEPGRVEAHDDLWALAVLTARCGPPGGVVMAGAVTVPDGRTAQWQMGALTSELFGVDFAERAESLVALGSPVRLRILQRLLDDASTVHELTETGEFGTSGQIYHHLRQLVAAGWLRATGRGRYEVPVARIVPLLTIFLAVDR